MRACERKSISLILCFVGGEWHPTTKISIGVGAPVSPLLDPLPEGEGKNHEQDFWLD
jgi:hypothetical protein